MSCENFWEQNGVYRKYKKDVTGKELLKAVKDVLGHQSFASIDYIINDMLEVTAHNVTASDVVTIAELDREASLINSYMKVAIVATEQTVKLMASFYGDLMSHSPYPIKVFDTVEQARTWVSEYKQAI